MPKVTEQIFTRPPMERMLNIHNRIQHGKHPNCPDLASEFEVSTRTIKRDIDFMKHRLDLPIEYDARRYGYLNPEEYLRGSFTVFKGTADYEIVLMFDRWAADLIRGRRWHATQDLTELPRGRLRMRLRLNSIEEMEGWILSWGKHVTVERPKELVHRIRRTAQRIFESYLG